MHRICRGFAKGIVAEVTEDFKVISRMTSLQAQHCLTTGTVQHRINYLLRMIPGVEVADYGDIIGLRQRAARPTEENGPAPKPTGPRSGPSQPSAVFGGTRLPTV